MFAWERAGPERAGSGLRADRLRPRPRTGHGNARVLVPDVHAWPREMAGFALVGGSRRNPDVKLVSKLRYWGEAEMAAQAGTKFPDDSSDGPFPNPA